MFEIVVSLNSRVRGVEWSHSSLAKGNKVKAREKPVFSEASKSKDELL